MKNRREATSDPVNSNEIISDYDFYFQLLLEEKALDFEIVLNPEVESFID